MLSSIVPRPHLPSLLPFVQSPPSRDTASSPISPLRPQSSPLFQFFSFFSYFLATSESTPPRYPSKMPVDYLLTLSHPSLNPDISLPLPPSRTLHVSINESYQRFLIRFPLAIFNRERISFSFFVFFCVIAKIKMELTYILSLSFSFSTRKRRNERWRLDSPETEEENICIERRGEIWDKCEESCRKVVVVLVSRKVVDTCNFSLLAPMEDIIKTTFSRILRSRTEQTCRHSFVLPGWRNSSLALTSKCESTRNGDARTRVCPPPSPR